MTVGVYDRGLQVCLGEVQDWHFGQFGGYSCASELLGGEHAGMSSEQGQGANVVPDYRNGYRVDEPDPADVNARR